MTIKLGLSLFGYHIGRLDIDVDMKNGQPMVTNVVDNTIKGISRRWVERLVR